MGKKCDNNLCISQDSMFVSGCSGGGNGNLRKCKIYCRLNPLPKYYKFLIPADINFKVNYYCGIFKIMSLEELMKILKLWEGSLAKDAKIKCTKCIGDTNGQIIYEVCMNGACPKHNLDYSSYCKILDSSCLSFCKNYIPGPISKYYKLLIPKDVEFHINYKIAPFKTISCPLNKLDSKESRSLGIVCTLEEGDINNG